MWIDGRDSGKATPVFHQQLPAGVDRGHGPVRVRALPHEGGGGHREAGGGEGLHRIGDLPVYAVDALCRRAQPLQNTAHADVDWIGLNAADASRIGLADGVTARVSQGGMKGEFEVRISDSVPEGGAWLRSATCNTRKFGHAFAPISVEVV